MPIYESGCIDQSCPEYAVAVEHYYSRMDSAMNPCEACGGETRKMASVFRVVFTGNISARYNNPKLEGAHQEGLWMTEKKTADGKERQTFVTDWSQRRRIMKQEGLEEYSGTAEVDSTGKMVGTRGMSGQWV